MVGNCCAAWPDKTLRTGQPKAGASSPRPECERADQAKGNAGQVRRGCWSGISPAEPGAKSCRAGLADRHAPVHAQRDAPIIQPGDDQADRLADQDGAKLNALGTFGAKRDLQIR